MKHTGITWFDKDEFFTFDGVTPLFVITNRRKLHFCVGEFVMDTTTNCKTLQFMKADNGELYTLADSDTFDDDEHVISIGIPILPEDVRVIL